MPYTFSYENEDQNVVDASVELTVKGEPDLDELLAIFQRFLVASGYAFDENENLEMVKKEKNPVFTFNNYCADFGDNNIYVGSGVLGGMGEDHIQFSSYAAGPVPIPGAAGKDIITFS